MARGGRSSNTRVFSASSTPAVGKKRRGGGEKGKPVRKNVDDAYEFVQELPKRHRTSAQQLSLTREEADEGPRRRRDDDEDSDEDMQSRIRKVAMMIAGDEAGVVDDEDDEDLDSDDAWEEEGSDEERWGDVFRDLKKGKGKKGKEVVKKPAKPLTVNLDETDDESDPEVERSPKTAFKSAFPDEEEDEEIEEDDEEEDGDEDEDEEMEEESDDEAFDEDPELPSDLSEDEVDDLQGLENFVNELANADKKKRKAEDGDEVEKGKKRRVLPVMSAPGLTDGGELALKNKSKVDLSSLIASAPGLDAKALLPSKKEANSTSVLKGGVLSAPLPTVVQERLDREAAYEKTKEEGQKWSGVMKRVKEAEHLAFPLQASERGGVKGAGEVIATFKPANAHESAVEALLAQANLTDKGVKAAEDAALKGQDLSVEEIAARRAELRHQRELMFRAESRAKRVAKIKSKTFRKLARKREAREAEKGEISLEDLERLDPEAAAEERERLERDRARERATLRHGAKTGRWARDMDAVEADEDQRMAKLEMLDMKERLQRKIHAVGSDDDSDESSEDDSDADEEAIKTRAFDQLAKLDAKTAPEPTKGIAGMAFMKKAAEREMKKVREAEAALRAELDGDEEAGSEDEDAPSMMKVGEGRMVFSGPAGSAAASTSSAPAKPTAAPAPERSPSPEPVLFGAANPWLADGAGSGPSRKRNTVSNSAEAKVVRTLKKAGKDRAAAADDEVVEISLDVKAKPAAAAAKKEEPKLKSILKKPAKKEEPKEAKDGSDSDSDDDNDELLPISGVKAFSQRELVAEAFAGDNVVEDFAAEKARITALDAPKVEDTTLAGWGSWAGKGVKKRKSNPNPRFLKTSAGVAAEDRKDANRANVIITEKRDKKATKHLAKDLPYPYTSVAQYEASFANPVGGEWNSRAGYQRQTLPRVVKKPGAIIEPVRKLF